MDLNAAKLFVAVVRAGSLSAAAQRTKTPLATLSRNVRELEEDLGVQLLERSARGVRMTDAGQLLYEHASRGVDTLDDGELAVTSRQAALKGRLRLSIPPSFEPWWALLSEFRKEHPDVQLAVYTSERSVDLGIEGIDVALRIGDVGHESVVAKRLFQYRHVLVASPKLLAAFGTPTTPEGLSALPCAAWVRDPTSAWAWRLGDRELAPTTVLTVNDYLHLRDRAVAGDFATELPPFLAAEALRNGTLEALLPDHPLPEQRVTLLYLRRAQPSRIVRAYLDHCERHVCKLAKSAGVGTGARLRGARAPGA